MLPHILKSPVFKLIVLGSFLLLTGCRATSPNSMDTSPARVRLPVVAVTQNVLPQVVTAPGIVAALPNHSVKLSPAISGKIIRMNGVLGQFVHAGESIATLDNRQEKASEEAAAADLAEAKANLDLAQSNLNRIRALYEAKIAPKKDLIAAENQVQTSRAHWVAVQARKAQADTAFQLTEVRSPIAGVVARRFLNVGDTADPSIPMVQIVDLSKIKIEANLPSDLSPFPHAGQAASIHAAHLSAPLPGTVTAVSSVIDLQSNTVPVEIRCVNRERLLREGETVTASINVGSHHALTVPASALVPDPNQPNAGMVYRVQAGVMTRVPVTTGIQWNNKIEILKGLRRNDVIVKSGAYGLPDGTPIDPISDSRP